MGRRIDRGWEEVQKELSSRRRRRRKVESTRRVGVCRRLWSEVWSLTARMLESSSCEMKNRERREEGGREKEGEERTKGELEFSLPFLLSDEVESRTLTTPSCI